jgi:hypothetical protein
MWHRIIRGRPRDKGAYEPSRFLSTGRPGDFVEITLLKEPARSDQYHTKERIFLTLCSAALDITLTLWV